jgi:hypothetical protein
VSGQVVILNRGPVVGNCALFWRDGGNGYTCDLTHAGKFESENAARICRNRPQEDFAIPLEVAMKFSERHCDVGELLGYLRSVPKVAP